MAGWRRQVKKACQELGHRGKAFEYKEVMDKLPLEAYRPTERQLKSELQRACIGTKAYLEIEENGHYRKHTKYRWKRRACRNTGTVSEGIMDDIDDEVSQLLTTLTESEPRTCCVIMSFDGSEVVVDQSLDVTVRGDATKARVAWLYVLPEVSEGDATKLGVNRQLIASMTGDEHRAAARDGEYALEFQASHSLVDCGLVLNALRLNGGVAYFDRGQRCRRGRA